jgi:serine/threonine protein kinase
MNDRVEQLLANDPLIGRTVLGRFEVLRPLARGGMGVLYLARTLGAKGFVKPVVVKRLGTDTSDEMLRMFVREAQVMAHLSHPNIVQAIDFNREGSQYLLVLEYVEGYTLGRWAKFMRANGREFPVQFAVQIVLDVLEALAYAHGLTAQDGSPATVIHRDVTPSNVMLSTDGHVKLLDFGIARLEHERSAEGPDGPTIKGKFAFLAPEVLAGDPPTANSDVYSAAVMLHELLVGRNEFAAEDLSATLVNVVKHRPSRLDAMRADVTSELAAVIEHALEKVPSLRFATAQEFAAALRAARGADPQHVREALVAQLRQDFFDPKLVESMGGYDLRTLAHAWQSEPTPRPSITAVDPASPNAQEQRATLPEVRPKRAPAAQQTTRTRRESRGRCRRAGRRSRSTQNQVTRRIPAPSALRRPVRTARTAPRARAEASRWRRGRRCSPRWRPSAPRGWCSTDRRRPARSRGSSSSRPTQARRRTTTSIPTQRRSRRSTRARPSARRARSSLRAGGGEPRPVGAVDRAVRAQSSGDRRVRARSPRGERDGHRGDSARARRERNGA